MVTVTTTHKENGMTIATTILEQMGGAGRIMAMTGAKQFIDHGDGVSFKFPNRQRSKPNWVKVTLRDDDTYTVHMGRIVRYDLRNETVFPGVYAEALRRIFEMNTGLYLSL